MKLTKQQLKKIIKEEISNILNEEGIPPVKLHLPHDVGTPEKLLAGVEAILKNPELASGRSKSQITREQAGQIINLINNKLKKHPPETIDDGLRKAKKKLQAMHGGQSSDRSQSYRDTAGHELAQQKARERRPVTQLGTMGLGESKLTKQLLKKIIKEEMADIFNETPEGGLDPRQEVEAGWQLAIDNLAALGKENLLAQLAESTHWDTYIFASLALDQLQYKGERTPPKDEIPGFEWRKDEHKGDEYPSMKPLTGEV